MFTKQMERFNEVIDREPWDRSYEHWQSHTDVIGDVAKSGQINMDFTVIYYWSILFLILLAFCIWLLSNKKTSRIIGSISDHLPLVSSIIWLLGVVLYIIGYYNPYLPWVAVIPRAIISSFKMFVATNELARVTPILHSDAIYMTAFATIHLAAAFITFMFIFKMVGYKIKSSVKILFHKWLHSKGRVVHLFWGVNEASCLLAEDIHEKHPTETIIFIDIDEECEDNTKKKPNLSHITNTLTIKSSEVDRLERIGALSDHCFNGPAAISRNEDADIFGILHLKSIGEILRKSCRSNIYFLSDDEAQNISGALNLQQDKTLRSMHENSPVIYIKARRGAYNEVFDHYSQYDSESSRMVIRIVDPSYLSVGSLKCDERALPVNCVAIDKSNGLVDQPFNALLVGFGSTGQEAFKFLYEFATFVGSNLKKSPFRCFAIDEKMNGIAGLIREQMPAIGKDELTLIQSKVDSEDFWMHVTGIINDLNYVVVALDDDSKGLSLAVNMFKSALKNRPSRNPMLKIMVRCYDNANEKRMSEVISNLNKAVEGSNVEIRLFGMESELYRCEVILSDITMANAKEFNRVYEGSELHPDNQWNINFGGQEINRLMSKKKMSRYHAIHDINRRIAQNISNSLHARTKMILMGFGENESSERLRLYYGYVNSRESMKTDYCCAEADSKLLMYMAIVEHERWISSHKLMGYTYGAENDSIRKHHKCMCPWEDLDEMTQSYDCNVVDTTIKMAYKAVQQ